MKVCPVCGTEYGDDAAFCSRDRSPLMLADSGKASGLVGQLIGERYQVERRIGEGGMGQVYLARHVLMGRACALKVMTPALSRDPDAVSRFNREATNASRIAHPNVCAVYDFGLTGDGLVYLAMEYVEGQALSDVLERTSPMPVDRAAGLIAQCAAGLEAAHELGIVHRDLKPDNIMVTSARDRETAKLVDFGIAKAIQGDDAGQRVTKTGFVVGTPEYMAPEQLAGDPVDGRSDQYALALVFYRAITGQLPFEGASVQETLVKRLTDPPRPLAIARPDVPFPAGLQGVMDRALARDPEQRFPSVTAFADAIHEITRGDAIATRRLDAMREASGITIPPTRQSQRPTRRAGIPFLITVAGAITAGAIWAVTRPDDTTSATPPNLVPVSPPAAAPDTTTQGSSAPASAPASAPNPAPPPATPSGIVGTVDSALPEPEDFDGALRPEAIPRTTPALENEALPGRVRARAAALLADHALRSDDKNSALEYFQVAERLFPANPRYRRMIRQLQDSVPL